ncbi:MAG: hypothetical protein CMH56_04275 [Myxococcales bacterium]|nr:hypothetical protein [Myxococcales bacterium]
MHTHDTVQPTPVVQPSKGLSLALLSLLIALGIYAVLAQTMERNDVPQQSSYVAAKSKILEMDYTHGRDALVFLPAWTLRPLQSMGDLEPIGSDMVTLLPPLPYKRLFVVEEPDASSEMKNLETIYGPPSQTWSIDNLNLHLWDLDPQGSFGTLGAHLDAALVQIKSRAETVECPWTIDKHQCDGEPNWQHVQRKWMRTTRNSTEMVWAHPPAKKSALHIQFPQQQKRAFLIIYGGHTRYALKHRAASVKMEVRFNNKKIAALTFGNDFPMALHSVAIPAELAQQGDLTFKISSKSNRKNNFGFDAFWSDQNMRGLP